MVDDARQLPMTPLRTLPTSPSKTITANMPTVGIDLRVGIDAKIFQEALASKLTGHLQHPTERRVGLETLML